MSYMSASTLGPVISIFLFAAHHNSWDPITLRNVFVVGIALEIFGGVAMLAFRDSCAIDGDGDDVAGVRRTSPGASVAALPPAPALASTPAAALDSRPPTPSPRVVWWVPHLIFASNLVLGIASGMTIKFFPLYFRCSVHLSPVAVQAIYASQPALIAAFSWGKAHDRTNAAAASGSPLDRSGRVGRARQVGRGWAWRFLEAARL